MEKLRHDFPNVLQRLFGVDFRTMNEDQIIEMAKKWLEQGARFEAFLLATKAFRFKYNEDRLDLMSKTVGFTLDINTIRKIKEVPFKDILFEILKDKNSSFLNFETVIIKCIVHQGNFLTLLLLIMYEWKTIDKTSERCKFVQKMIDVYGDWVSIKLKIFDLFHEACNLLASKKLSNPTLIIHLSQKLIERGEWRMLLRFYEYYSYLGESKIYEPIFQVLLESNIPEVEFERPFANSKDFFWSNPVFTFDVLVTRYERLLKTKNGREAISDLLPENSIGSLIPFCICAKEAGDVELEAAILWYALRKSSSSGLLDRMSEISGFKAPDEFLKTGLENRANWLSNRLMESMKAFESDKPHLYIHSVKQAYTVQPFKSEVLRVLFKLDGLSQDSEIEKMLLYSIGKMTSCVVLGRLLSYAVTAKSQYGLRLVLRRLILLGHYDTILFALEQAQKFLKQNDLEQGILVAETIDSYEEFIPKNKVHTKKLEQLKKWHSQYQQQNIDGALFSSNEKNRMLQEKEAFDLLGKKEYNKLFKQFEQGKISSPVILELMLRSALARRNEKDVVLVYKELVQVDSAFASFYNLEVAPYFLRQKISWELKNIGTSNLVSNVWGRPAVLEHPVNKLTLRIIGYPDDVKGPRKKKLKF